MLPDVGANELRRFLLGGAADFSDQHEAVGLRVSVHQSKHINEIRTDDGVAANANAGGLPDAERRQLPDGFIGQRAAARNHAHVARKMDAPGHDPDFALAGRNDARAVWPDKSRRLAREELLHAHHVEGGDAFGDANYKREAGVRGLHDGVGGKGRRNENDGNVRAGLLPRLADGVEHRHSRRRSPALARRHPRDYLRAVFNRLLGVEAALTARDALDEKAGVLVNQYWHRIYSLTHLFIGSLSFLPCAERQQIWRVVRWLLSGDL